MKIDDKTTIPLAFALGSLPVIFGFVVWLTSIDAKATKGAAIVEVVMEIRDRLIRIETKLDEKRENK